MLTDHVSSRAEWRRGWPVVAASMGGVALSTAHIYSMGVLIAPLEAEFGWTRAQISAGLMIGALLAVVTSPLIGLLIDRIGPRLIALAGAMLYLSALAMLALAGPSIWSWLALWVLLAIGVSGITPTVWTFAVSAMFERGRGLALAMTLAGTGTGSTLTPLVTSALSVAYGWRVAYVGLAAFWAVIVLPLLYLCFTGVPDRRTAIRDRGMSVEIAGLSVREGFRLPRFYMLAFAATAIALVAVSFVVNLVPILVSTGLSRTRAAEIASIVGVASIVGRLSGGFLLDRYDGRLIAAGSVLLPIGGCLLLLTYPGSIPASIAATVLVGLSLGAELDAVAYLATRHLGMRSFGVLFGTISSLLSLATGLGPLLVSHVFDVTRSYAPALWGFIPICLVASTLFVLLGRYPVFRHGGSA